MGYEFALDDKSRLEELDPIEYRLYCNKNRKESFMDEAEWEALKAEALTMVRERCELIFARQKEMGYELEDNTDKQVHEWKEVYLEDSNDGD